MEQVLKQKARKWLGIGDETKAVDPAKYTWGDLQDRVEELNKGGLVLSNQYGMVFLLNKQGQIILNLTDLVSREERMRYA